MACGKGAHQGAATARVRPGLGSCESGRRCWATNAMKRKPQKYANYARTKLPERRPVRENNWGWRYPKHGGVCLWRKMWIDYLDEERRKPNKTYPLAQLLAWNYPPGRSYR